MELGSKPIRKRSKKRQSIDLPFLILTILLLSIGLITLFSASYVDAINSTQSGDGAFYFKRQGMFALAGIVCMPVSYTHLLQDPHGIHGAGGKGYHSGQYILLPGDNTNI